MTEWLSWSQRCGLMGGRGDGFRPLAAVQVFDGKTQTWHFGPSLPELCYGMKIEKLEVCSCSTQCKVAVSIGARCSDLLKRFKW